jgi:prepilin-type N-terminal cleavage/methylation domain-containing protein
MNMRVRSQQAGFTMIEVLVVLAIIAVLFGLSTVSLGRPQTDVSISSSVDTLLSDLKSQQLLAMAGDKGDGSSQQPHGIYIQPHSYTLFSGSTYSAGASGNYEVNEADVINLSTNLPSGQVVFAKSSGEVIGYTGGSNNITVTSGDTNKVITIGRLGALNTN